MFTEIRPAFRTTKLVFYGIGIGVSEVNNETTEVVRRMGTGLAVLSVSKETTGVVNRIGWVGVDVELGRPP